MLQRPVMGPKIGAARPKNEIELVHSSTRSLLPLSLQGKAAEFSIKPPSPWGSWFLVLVLVPQVQPRPGRQQVGGTQPKVEHAKGHHHSGSRPGHRLRARPAGIWQRAVPHCPTGKLQRRGLLGAFLWQLEWAQDGVGPPDVCAGCSRDEAQPHP